jgi:ubiquinone/menaquinone biosynthesis C-methylase UbiE
MNQDTKYLYNAGYFKKAAKYIAKPERLDYLTKIVLSCNPKKVLDVGCGVGQLVESVRDRGVDAYGTDFSPALPAYWGDKPYFKVADADKQPFGDKEFDLVISADFFEHVKEEDVEAVAAEMIRVGKRVLAWIAVEKKLNERQLLFHVVNKPLEWWVAKLPGIEVFNSREYE